MIRDSLKKEISPLLGLCIQAPRTSRVTLVKGSLRSVANTAARQALIAHWQGIVNSLGNFLNTLKENHVSPMLVRKVFTQIFSFINIQQSSIEMRITATEKYAGVAWEHIRQAIGFLVVHQKPKKTLDEISHELCPVR
ncbi:myosin-like protein XIE [Salvia divinorum]|uniref:Myosin-like protein XIE n=1 Tax=Salvia divinorum TaxID=28513 RepID=A0ABD1H2P9_SALDI